MGGLARMASANVDKINILILRLREKRNQFCNTYAIELYTQLVEPFSAICRLRCCRHRAPGVESFLSGADRP